MVIKWRGEIREKGTPRDANHLSNGALGTSTGGSATVVVDGDLSLLSGDWVGNGEERVHCSDEDEMR